ncbi:MAG TPA: MBL fold metallo-hydrolase, partial [Kofleriaceae bacterium]|nr:MBL fold metallo-hydrolase [Kofleriaceae bacterium]
GALTNVSTATQQFQVTHFYDPATSTLTYLVFDPASRDAVVIDPVMDFDAASGRTSSASTDRVAQAISSHGLTLHYVLETHAHADHLSGSQHLKRLFGAKVAIGERITEVQATFQPIFDLPAFALDGSQFDRLLRDGETVHAGTLAIDVLATPGHTPACVSYLIGDAVFTGDALFVEDSGTGRCDFPRGNAEALFHSVHDRLYALPGATRVFVGHDYQPDGRALAFETTIERERRGNIQLTSSTTAAEYVAFRTARDRTLAAPKLLLPSIQVNVDAGRLPAADVQGRRFLRLPVNLGAATLDDGSR